MYLLPTPPNFFSSLVFLTLAKEDRSLLRSFLLLALRFPFNSDSPPPSYFPFPLPILFLCAFFFLLFRPQASFCFPHIRTFCLSGNSFIHVISHQVIALKPVNHYLSPHCITPTSNYIAFYALTFFFLQLTALLNII